MSSQAPQPQFAWCDEKERLVDAYGAAVNEYSRTVITLRGNLGILPKAEYDLIRAFSEDARVRCDTAHHALDRHIQLHGC